MLSSFQGGFATTHVLSGIEGVMRDVFDVSEVTNIEKEKHANDAYYHQCRLTLYSVLEGYAAQHGIKDVDEETREEVRANTPQESN